jgi:hypothetical protein
MKRRCSDACRVLKLLLPSLAFRPKEPKPARGRLPVSGSIRLTVYLANRWCPSPPIYDTCPTKSLPNCCWMTKSQFS